MCRCHVPECEGNASRGEPPARELWQPEWTAWALPAAGVADAACHRHSPRAPAADEDAECHPQSFDNTTSQACDNYVYQFHVSIVPEVPAMYS